MKSSKVLLPLYFTCVYVAVKSLEVPEAITYGTRTLPTTFPHQMALLRRVCQRRSWRGYYYCHWKTIVVCGGSLVHRRWMQTARHCFSATLRRNYSLLRRYYYVAAGMYGVRDRFTRYYIIARLVITGPRSDIALIKLHTSARTLVRNRPISPVFIAPYYLNPEYVSDCYISGWGYTRGGKITPARYLRRSHVRILSHAECRRRWGPYVNPPTHLCVVPYSVTDYRSACYGDSGSPLSCRVRGRWYLMGSIHKVFPGCTFPHHRPNIITNVPLFRYWIAWIIRRY